MGGEREGGGERERERKQRYRDGSNPPPPPPAPPTVTGGGEGGTDRDRESGNVTEVAVKNQIASNPSPPTHPPFPLCFLCPQLTRGVTPTFSLPSLSFRSTNHSRSRTEIILSALSCGQKLHLCHTLPPPTAVSVNYMSGLSVVSGCCSVSLYVFVFRSLFCFLFCCCCCVLFCLLLLLLFVSCCRRCCCFPLLLFLLNIVVVAFRQVFVVIVFASLCVLSLSSLSLSL